MNLSKINYKFLVYDVYKSMTECQSIIIIKNVYFERKKNALTGEDEEKITFWVGQPPLVGEQSSFLFKEKIERLNWGIT